MGATREGRGVHPFEYAAPETLAEALALLREHGAEAKVLAGGQSLVPLLNYRLARPRLVVDINGLPLAGVRVDNGSLQLGALTRHHELEELPEIARSAPLLPEVARLIGNVRVRSLGTVGGSLAHADPAAELPMAVVALDARLTLASASGSRTVPARDFFTGYLSTALAPDELLTAIEVPVTLGTGWAVEEFARRAGDFAVAWAGGSAPLPKPPPGRAPADSGSRRASDALRLRTPTPVLEARSLQGAGRKGLMINGRARDVDIRPGQTLLEVLRDTLGIFDVKEGCGEGICGACTVLLDGRPVSSCLTLAAAARGRALLTVSGLEREGGLHPLQEAFVRHGGVQCGFCTPGMLLTTLAFLERHPRPSRDAIRTALEGNLCRCTGYAKILDAVLAYARGADGDG